MTNNIAAATAQIALNKNTINMLHQAIHYFKIWREKANKDNDEVYVKLLNAAIKKNSRQIKQYVVVQKAAKKHLAEMIANSRCSFYVEQKSLETVLKSMRTALNQESLLCITCGGNDADMPCAYPREGKMGCPRTDRLYNCGKGSV